MVCSIGALRLLRPPHAGRPFAFPVEVTVSSLALVDEEAAAHYAGRPRVTIRRWAHEGRIQRYGKGRGRVRYNVFELNPAIRDEDTGELLEAGSPPPLPSRSVAA
jgi:hypothetical protein